MSSTLEIEYRGTLADSASGGDKRTLAAWGLSGIPELTMLNLARGNMVLTVDGSTSFLADRPWAYRDKVVLWRDGARYWHGWLSQAPRAAEPAADSISMVFADPWWWLEQTAMSDPTVKNLVVGNVSWEDIDLGQTLSAIRNVSITWAEPSGDIVWSNWRDQARYTVQGCIRRAYYAAVRTGAPITLGSIGIDAPAPAQESAGNTALDYLVGAVAYEPNAVGWWDYSGATPTLHVQPRSALSALSYDLDGCPIGVQCAPLYEQQALAVRIRWHYPDADGDETIYTEHAGTAGLTGGPNVLVLDASVGSYAERVEAVSYGIAARMYAALGPLAYAGSLSLTDDTTSLAAARPGAALNLLSGRAEWATMAGIVQQLSISVVAEAESCSVQWGAARHLGINDWLDLAQRLDGSAGSAVDPDSTGSSTGPTPGTVGELNGAYPFASNPSGTISTQVRGGQWQAQGFSPNPYVSAPSLPLYRLATISGGSVAAQQDVSPTSIVVSHTGSSSVADNGTVTPGIIYSWSASNGGSGGPETQSRLWHTGPGGLAMQWYCFARSATRRTLVLRRSTIDKDQYGQVAPASLDDGVAGWVYGPGPGSDPENNISGSGETIETLSSPDGEEKATARMLTAAEWAEVSESSTAIRTVPSTVTNGIYRELRVGTYVNGGSGLVYTPLTGQMVWQRYRLAIALERRPVDQSGTATGEWASAGTVYSTPWITNLEGEGGCEWYTIEPDAGYETRVASVTPEHF